MREPAAGVHVHVQEGSGFVVVPKVVMRPGHHSPGSLLQFGVPDGPGDAKGRLTLEEFAGKHSGPDQQPAGHFRAAVQGPGDHAEQ